jgi:hypothetical protein
MSKKQATEDDSIDTGIFAPDELIIAVPLVYGEPILATTRGLYRMHPTPGNRGFRLAPIKLGF